MAMGPVQDLTLKAFRSGLITRVPDTDIPDDAFSDVENMELTDKFMPTKARGHNKYNSVGMAADVTRGGSLYVQTDGTKRYIFASGGKIYFSVVGTGTFAAIQQPGGGADLTISDESDVSIVQYLDALWIVNGKFPIITNGGFGTSKMIKILGTTATSITVSGLPQGIKRLVVHQERLFGLGNIDEPNGLVWSEPFAPENWTPLYGVNFDFVGKDDDELITGGISYQGYLYVGKPRNIYRFLTLGDITQWTSQRVDTSLGWIAHRTIQEFYGHVAYLSTEGVALFDGNTARLISEGIRDKMLELPQLKNNLRQFLQTSTADFDTGSFGNLIDTSDAEIKQLPQTSAADFAAGIARSLDKSVNPGEVTFVVPDDAPQVSLARMVEVGDFLYQVSEGGAKVFLRYSKADGTWSTMAPMPSNSRPAGLVTDGTDIWATTENSFEKFYKYTVSTNSWTELSDFPGGSQSLGLALVGDFIYVLRANGTATFFRYKISTDTWDTRADAPATSTTTFELVTDGTFIYAAEQTKDQLYRYSIAGDSWVTLTAPGVTLQACQMTYDGANFLYMARGQNTDTFLRYSISGDSWATLAVTPEVILNADNGTVATSIYIYLTTGAGGSTPPPGSATLNRYSVLDDTWTPLPRFITQTLDYNITPASFGNLAAEITGTATFETKSSATDLSDSDWELAAGWSALLANGDAIPSTLERYLRVRFKPTVGACNLKTLFVGGVPFRSQQKNLGFTPTAWSSFESAYNLNGQTITWFMKSAATQGGLAGATFFQQTPGNTITSVPLNPWVEVEIRFNTNLFSQVPTVGSFQINFFVGVALLDPCAVVWRGTYWLNVVSVGGSINDKVFLYNKDGNYWLVRTNKKNNIYFIDGDNLVSGTSESDGFVRFNDVGTQDDGADIVSFFETKNFELAPLVKLFRHIYITSKSDANWTFGHSVDNAAFISIIIPLSALTTTIKKVLTGIVRGQFIKFRVTQANEDVCFEFNGFRVLWRILRDLVVTA